jgi:hypothetical protein
MSIKILSTLVFEFRDLNLLRAWNLEFRISPKELDG